MNQKKLVGGSLSLVLMAAAAFAGILLVSTPEEACAGGGCLGPFQTERWGKGASCAAAQADLNAQASAVCEIFPWDGPCGSITIVSQSGCYYAGGQFVIDGVIEASCFLR